VGPIIAQNVPAGASPAAATTLLMHTRSTDPAGNFVIANDLGLDPTIWKFDRVNGKLLDPKTFRPRSRASSFRVSSRRTKTRPRWCS
jgi:hypothetical protein